MVGLIESTEKLFAEALATMKKKNADYSGTKDGMKNFRISAQVANVKMSQDILTRLTDKVTRIGNLIVKDANVKDETIFDTIQDLINYAAILHYAFQIELRDGTYKIIECTSDEKLNKYLNTDEVVGEELPPLEI